MSLILSLQEVGETMLGVATSEPPPEAPIESPGLLHGTDSLSLRDRPGAFGVVVAPAEAPIDAPADAPVDLPPSTSIDNSLEDRSIAKCMALDASSRICSSV